jgi:hypothetical protein
MAPELHDLPFSKIGGMLRNYFLKRQIMQLRCHCLCMICTAMGFKQQLMKIIQWGNSLPLEKKE